MFNLKEKREKANELQKQIDAVDSEMETILSVSEKRDGKLTKEERTSFDAKKLDFNTKKSELKDLRSDIAELEEATVRNAERVERKAKKEEPALGPLIPKNFRYSISKAVSDTLNGKLTGLEDEMQQEAEKENRNAGVSAVAPSKIAGAISIPSMLVRHGKPESEKRAVTIGTEGTDIMQTDLGSLIPILIPDPIVLRMGAQYMGGLTGDFQLPRASGQSTIAWATETGSLGTGDPTFDNIKFTPHRLGGYVDVTLQTLIQSSFPMETYLRNRISTDLELALDLAAVNGSGSSNQPTGVMGASGVGVVTVTNGAAPTWARALLMMSTVQAANAFKGKLGFLTTPQAQATMAKTPRQSSGVEGSFIIRADDYNNIAGFQVQWSNQVPANLTNGTHGAADLSANIFGNWNELIIGQFGALNLLVDPYTQALAGEVRLVIQSFYDVKVMHGASFVVDKAIITS